MEIYYFGTNGEKVGPITKEGLVNLAKAGVITEETVLEVNGQKAKGKQVKNLRPIFEEQKQSEPKRPAQSTDIEETPPTPPMTEESTFPLSPENPNEDATDSELYKISDFDSGQPESKTDSAFEGDSQNSLFNQYLFSGIGGTAPYNPQIENDLKRNENNLNPSNPLLKWLQLSPYVKFQRFYRIIISLLHAVFIVGMIISISGYLDGKKSKHNGQYINEESAKESHKFTLEGLANRADMAERLITQGEAKARTCRNWIFVLLASYPCLLLSCYFMSAVVYLMSSMVNSTEKKQRTVVLLEESLKSKNEQEGNGAEGEDPNFDEAPEHSTADSPPDIESFS